MSRSGSAARDAQDARRVGAALEVRLAAAVAHRDVGVGDRRRVVELRDPHERGFAAELEVHAEVGDERGRAHVERLGLRRAAPRRASGSRARPRRSPPAAAECRRPRTPWRRPAWAPTMRVVASALREDRRREAVALDDPVVGLVVVLALDLVGAREPAQPRDDLHLLAALDLHDLARDRRVLRGSRAHRARRQRPAAPARRCAPSPAACGFSSSGSTRSRMPKSAANFASGGFSSVRTRSGNERALASARPASSLRSVGNLDAELRLLRQAGTEGHARRCPRPRPSAASRDTPCPARVDEADLLRVRLGDRRGERQRERQDRDALRVLVDALAGERRAKRRAAP